MRTINEIILHCTATPEGRPVTVAEIDAWHRARGWSGTGYHRIIGINGERWAGRPIEVVGAHCEGHNSGTLGVVYVGGLSSDARIPKDTRNAAQQSALLVELTELRDRFNIRKISGHNEYAAKACPSFNASKEYDHLFEGRSKAFQPILDKVLRRGDMSAGVASWREQLITWRAIAGGRGSLSPGSLFDHAVELETLAFQRSRGIVVDGKVGPQTMMEMERALGGRPPFQAMG